MKTKNKSLKKQYEMSLKMTMYLMAMKWNEVNDTKIQVARDTICYPSWASKQNYAIPQKGHFAIKYENPQSETQLRSTLQLEL